MSRNLAISGNGYNNTMYQPKRFNSLVSALAAIMPTLLKEYGATHIAVQGKSGIAVAFAVAAQVNIGIIVVRKEGENTHSNKLESDGRVVKGYMFFDDFIATGATRSRVVRDLDLYAKMQGAAEPELKGSIVWGRGDHSYSEISILKYGCDKNLITQAHMDYLCYKD